MKSISYKGFKPCEFCEFYVRGKCKIDLIRPKAFCLTLQVKDKIHKHIMSLNDISKQLGIKVHSYNPPSMQNKKQSKKWPPMNLVGFFYYSHKTFFGNLIWGCLNVKKNSFWILGWRLFTNSFKFVSRETFWQGQPPKDQKKKIKKIKNFLKNYWKIVDNKKIKA